MNEYEWHLLEDKNRVESLEIAGAEVRCGDRVRLRPRQGGDVFDVALAGRIATIEAIEQDYEGQFHLSVVVDEDPGRDMGMARQPGHRFFFAPSEVEPMSPAGGAASAAAARTPTILIAGIGNIFLGDDAFGVEVSQRLANKKLPRGVRAIDFGIRGFDLAYALLDGTDVTILVDACPRGEKPGTLYIIEPDLDSLDTPDAESAPPVDGHVMNPVNVLRLAKTLGGPLKKILLVACEPESLGGDEGRMGLSDTVTGSIDEAVRMVESLVDKILAGQSPAEETADNLKKGESSNANN
jgi:hydrogenase maturation protease